MCAVYVFAGVSYVYHMLQYSVMATRGHWIL